MPCRRLSTAYTMTAVPRPIRCCRATTRTDKWQGRSTRRNQEEPLGLITFGDGGSAPQVTRGALPKQDSRPVAHHGEHPWHPGGGAHRENPETPDQGRAPPNVAPAGCGRDGPHANAVSPLGP